MRKVIVISSQFPPDNGIAVRRVSAFVKHLPSYGWRPFVVTTGQNLDSGKIAGSSESDLEDSVLLRFTEYGGRVGSARSEQVKLLLKGVLESPLGVFNNEWTRRISREKSDLVPMQFWTERKKIAALIRSSCPDVEVIYATAPTNASLRLAKWLAEELSIPWIADLRDNLLMLNSGREERIQSALRREKTYLASCEEAVTVSKGCAEEIGERCGRELKVITNGFEGELRPKVGPSVNEQFTIRYTGKLRAHPMQDATAFFGGLCQLLSEEPAVIDKISVEFYGGPSTKSQLQDYLVRFPGAKPVCHYKGMTSWEEVTKLQEDADVLLLLTQPDTKGILTGKVFEYLRTGNSLLVCPGDGGELDSLTLSTGLATIGPSSETVTQFLRERIQCWSDGHPLPEQESIDHDEVNRFSRWRLTGQLADLLCGVTKVPESAK